MIYANDNDKAACEWLKKLPLAIDHVDSRSIAIVKGSDVKHYTQCHFFAGIGGWSYALQLAQWPVGVPVWTGSCPCQPFSNAGKRKGAQDKEKALWPEFRRLIAECHPPIIFGEQVSSKLGRSWLAGVRLDLEALGYAVGAADLCGASVGAPHIRQRLFWVAYSQSERGWSQFRAIRSGEEKGLRETEGQDIGRAGEQAGRFVDSSPVGWVADDNGDRFGEAWDGITASRDDGVVRDSRTDIIGLEHTESDGREQGRTEPVRRFAAQRCSEGGMGQSPIIGDGSQEITGSDREGEIQGRWERISRGPSAFGFWDDADYLYCSDGKYRPVEPGTFPLAHGVPNRVAKLRGLGNAVIPQVAAIFIRSFIESITESQGRPSCPSMTSKK